MAPSAVEAISNCSIGQHKIMPKTTFSRSKFKKQNKYCDQKKMPNVYKSCLKIISLKNDRFNTFTKIDKECGNFGQINCCQRFLKLPKVQ